MWEVRDKGKSRKMSGVLASMPEWLVPLPEMRVLLERNRVLWQEESRIVS